MTHSSAQRSLSLSQPSHPLDYSSSGLHLCPVSQLPDHKGPMLTAHIFSLSVSGSCFVCGTIISDIHRFHYSYFIEMVDSGAVMCSAILRTSHCAPGTNRVITQTALEWQATEWAPLMGDSFGRREGFVLCKRPQIATDCPMGGGMTPVSQWGE